MSQMHNPCHPGEVLKEALSEISVTDAAKRLGVGRVALSRTWTILRFVSGDFVAHFRGRLVIAPPLQLADVRAFGLLIGEGQSGPFRVELELPRAG